MTMPLPDNAGGLVMLLIIIAVLGLALLVRYATHVRCADCGHPLGDRPRFWRLGERDGVSYRPRPEPLCAACFTASGPVGE